MAVPDPRSQRVEPRIPFFTPVVASGLRRCWATNISSNGIGLTGYAGAATPEQGDSLELEWVLGESQKPMHAIGRVAWISSVRPDGRLGLGVALTQISAADRAEVARFLADHRPRVVAAMASSEEADVARRALGHLDIDFVTSADDVDEELLRSSASIVVFGHDAAKLTAFLDAVWRSTDSGYVPGEVPLAPITLCTTVESDLLLPLFTEGRTYEVLRPPIDRRALASAVERSCHHWALQAELRWASVQLEGIALRQTQTRSSPRDTERRSQTMIRVSASMREVHELIRTVAAHDVPVLLAGETGTGKELAAREIHALSNRANTPFVAQDCGALTETLLESELFGHVRGAFTGATADHPGLFQIADGGTIFLDEIQNTSPSLQAKLLRVVEEGEVRPVGGTKPRRVDVRLITACNIDLKQLVKDQRFRADFYYRLNRFPIELPPLRQRRQDIPPLAKHFLTLLSDRMGRRPPALQPDSEALLMAYDWPGNVRELKNTIERALLLTPIGEPVRATALPDDLRGPPAGMPEGGGLDALVAEYERGVIKAALDRHAGVVRRAARELEVNPVTLARKMRKLGLGD